MLLHSDCGARVAEDRVRRVRLYYDNVVVVYIVRGTVSASTIIMRELRILKRLLCALKVTVETGWLPSAENVFGYSPSTPMGPRGYPCSILDRR